MSSVSIVVEGVDALRARLAEIGEAQRARLRTAIANGAAAVQAEAVRSIQDGPKSGILYGPTRAAMHVGMGTASKSESKKVHQASAPGEAPAADSGELAGKISVRPSVDGLSAEVVSAAPYSADLEFGTDTIEPRPFMRPALAANADKINADIRDAMRADP